MSNQNDSNLTKEEQKTTSKNTNNQNTANILPLSAAAIVGVSLGGLGVVGCLIPILNNVSFFFGLIGLIFAIVGMVTVLKGKKGNKVLAYIGLILCILTIVGVLISQNIYGKAVKDAFEGPSVVSTESNNQNDKNDTDNKNVKVGETVKLSNGLELTVVSVEGGLKNFDGSAVSRVSIKYVNNGDKEVSYNAFDWKAENINGAQTSDTFYSDSNVKSNANNLGSGKLATGGTVSGVLYFKGDVAKMLYSSSFISDSSVTWINS